MPLVKTAVQPGPNPACAGSTSPGDHMDDSTTVIKRTRTPSPGSDSLKDEMEMVEQFVKEFKHRYSGPHKHLPAFEKDTLENILRKAKNCSPREKKPLAIYMHHDRNENFSSDVLCSNCVAAYLNGNFVVWGWDLTSSKQIHRVTKPIRGYVSPSLSMKIKNAGDNRLPLLLTICYTSWGPEVLSYIHGTSSVSDVMNCLTISKRVFDDNLSIELQKLEESECKKTASWSIPWKEENNATLEPSREDKAKLKLRETHKKEVEETRKKELLQAMSSGDLNTIQKIHDQGGDLKILVKTAHQGNVTWCLLTLAAYDGHTHLIQPLLDAGLNVDGDHQKESGFFEEFTTSWTPLMVAARQGHVRMIEELLSCGANPLAKDQKGATALHHAAFCGHVACVRVLRSWTSPAITDNSGRTPIHAACLRGHLPVIKLLAESGWKLDAVDEENNTALHMSSWYGSLEVVKYLYRADSNVNPYKKNRERLTPFDYAVREGHHHIERWFMKMQGSHSMNLNYTHHLIKSLQEDSEDYFEVAKRWLSTDNVEGIGHLCIANDAHWMDKNGMTILHLAVTQIYCSSKCTAKLLEGIIHPHVLNLEGLTPLDLARQEFRKSGLNQQRKIIQILEEHQCPEEYGSPEELYGKLLKIISEGDNVEAVSHLLCAGAPMELVGNFPNSALQLAITNDCSRIVSLLLASGASLTPCTEGLNLLQQAWYSPNTTSKVLCAINYAFSRQLKRERNRLPRYTNGLREDLAKLITIVDGDKPWEACWQSGRTMAKLTSFMVMAVRANCPLIAGFLQWAGAGAFFSASRKTTPLHAALEEGNLSLTETLMRDLGASLYIPDAEGRFPKAISNMTPALLDKLEIEMYEREQRHLESLKEHKKDESEKQMVQAVLNLQKDLFNIHISNFTDEIFLTIGALNDDGQETVAYALLVASRSGLQQLLYLLVTVAHLPADLIVDVTSNTTALHEAAAHGKSGCVALLLSMLNNAARINDHIDIKLQSFATKNELKLKRLNRYSPLQPDKYGQTALHLAAMFGHKHTMEYLQENVKEDPPCRAGTTAQNIHKNFTGYLKRYMRYNDNMRKEMTPLDHHEADYLLHQLLCTIDLKKLPKEAKRANIDLNMNEAEQVKKAVQQAVGIILGRVVAFDDTYKGRLELVGSAQDGSKLFAPDEFDINIVIPAADRVTVSVHQELDESVRYQGHVLKITVETNNPHLQGNRLMGDLFGAVKQALTDSVLDDKRLSVVPPSLTRTQVGVALAMAWQGMEYPLLLVGVDLVPVLEVPWHEVIVKPDALTPPDTNVMHISNTADGSWRCSFALIEAEVLRQLSPEERRIQLSCKMLLYFLKVEPWMPKEIKSFCTWWTGRSFNLPVPTGFCLKSSFFRLLAFKRNTGTQWLEEDTIFWMAFAFRTMCQQIANKAEADLSPRKVFAYFGGDCEGPKIGHGAPIITHYLFKRELKKRLTISTLMRYLNCLMASVWKYLNNGFFFLNSALEVLHKLHDYIFCT